jgi:hypothetical protein
MTSTFFFRIIATLWKPFDFTARLFLCHLLCFGRIPEWWEYNTPDDEDRSISTGFLSLPFKGVRMGQPAGRDGIFVLLFFSLFLFNLLLLLSSAAHEGAHIMIHQLHSHISSRFRQHVCLVASWSYR